MCLRPKTSVGSIQNIQRMDYSIGPKQNIFTRLIFLAVPCTRRKKSDSYLYLLPVWTISGPPESPWHASLMPDEYPAQICDAISLTLNEFNGLLNFDRLELMDEWMNSHHYIIFCRCEQTENHQPKWTTSSEEIIRSPFSQPACTIGCRWNCSPTAGSPTAKLVAAASWICLGRWRFLK